MIRLRRVAVVVSFGLAAGCMQGNSPNEPSEPLDPFASSSGFPTSNAPGIDTVSSSTPETITAEDMVSEPEVGTSDTHESGDSSPYECEPFTSEECVTACGTVGTRKCIKEWGPCVVPEVCNGIDDDCNGIIDDGPDGPPTEEICDGLDNDCDGEIDEGLFQDCGCHGVTSSKVACTDGQYPACPAPQPATLLVEIPELEPNCPFGEGDNWPKTGGKAAARVEQDIPFSFPEDHLVCSLSLSGASDNFYYDDTIVLALNGIALISSTQILNKFDLEDGLPVYAWDKLVGESIGAKGPECLEGATSCQMPGTQENGEVSLSFDADTSEQLVKTGEGVDHVFTAIVTGDDNPPLDCHHNGLTIKVDYMYVPK